MVYVSNAFSLQMTETTMPHTIHAEPVTVEQVAESIQDGFTSAIGHADTANVVAGLLKVDVHCQRINVRLAAGDVLFVAQLTGGRLPEGATTLPEGFNMVFQRVTVD